MNTMQLNYCTFEEKCSALPIRRYQMEDPYEHSVSTEHSIGEVGCQPEETENVDITFVCLHSVEIYVLNIQLLRPGTHCTGMELFLCHLLQ